MYLLPARCTTSQRQHYSIRRRADSLPCSSSLQVAAKYEGSQFCCNFAYVIYEGETPYFYFIKPAFKVSRPANVSSQWTASITNLYSFSSRRLRPFKLADPC